MFRSASHSISIYTGVFLLLVGGSVGELDLYGEFMVDVLVSSLFKSKTVLKEAIIRLVFHW